MSGLGVSDIYSDFIFVIERASYPFCQIHLMTQPSYIWGKALLLKCKLERQFWRKWGLTETQTANVGIRMMYAVRGLSSDKCASCCKKSLDISYFVLLLGIGVWHGNVIVSERNSLNVVFLYLLCCAPVSSNMTPAMAERNWMKISHQIDIWIE